MINYTVSNCHYIRKGSNKDLWEYRIYYQDPITRKPKEKSKKEFKSKLEAKLEAEEMERRLREGYEQIDNSLKEYLNTWLKDTKRNNSKKHLNYTSDIFKIIYYRILKTFY